MRTLKCDDCGAAFQPDDGRSDESGNYCEPCYRAAWVQGALSAGIPRSVIEGRTRLTDHFSEEYINWKCNRERKDET